MAESSPRVLRVVTASSPYLGVPCYICRHAIEAQEIITLVIPDPPEAPDHRAAVPVHLNCMVELGRARAERA
jgi:hypothetical protein